MDPAFSLADELAELHHHHHHPHQSALLDEDELHFHLHSGGASLGDEFDQLYHHNDLAFGSSLDAELEGLHLGNDLASELDGAAARAGGCLADELDPQYALTNGSGSLGDELSHLHDQGSDQDSAALMSRHPSSTLASSSNYGSGASSPNSRQRILEYTGSSPSRRTVSSSSSSAAQTATSSTAAAAATADATTTISLLVTSQTAEMEESVRATQAFLSNLSSLSSKPSTTTAQEWVGEGEDTAKLETLASGYLKLVSECTAEREAQLRELRELDRKTARTLQAESSASGGGGFFRGGISGSGSYDSDLNTLSPGVSSVLTSTTMLADLDEEDSEASFLSSPSHTIGGRGQSRRRHLSTASLSSDTTITDLSLTNPIISSSSTAASSATAAAAGTAGAETNSGTIDPSMFAPFYTSTSQLITSLTGLHEHTQITKSSSADAARKLKTLKGLIGQWKVEQESVEQSELWISTHGRADDDGAGVGIGRRREWVGEQVDWCRKQLDEAQRRATQLLTPVSIAL